MPFKIVPCFHSSITVLTISSKPGSNVPFMLKSVMGAWIPVACMVVWSCKHSSLLVMNKGALQDKENSTVCKRFSSFSTLPQYFQNRGFLVTILAWFSLTALKKHYKSPHTWGDAAPDRPLLSLTRCTAIAPCPSMTSFSLQSPCFSFLPPWFSNSCSVTP